VFSLSAAIAAVAGALFGAMESVAGSTDFYYLQSLPILILVVVAGVATASGALVAGISFGLLGGDLFIGAGFAGVLLGALPDGIVPGVYAKLNSIRNAIVGRFPGTGVGSGATAPRVSSGVSVGSEVSVRAAVEMGAGVVEA
jgi:branched-subunit amino acid ABC-type transport system permease component